MAVVGVSDHCGWAVLVTVAAGGKVVDRRRVELLAGDLPRLPHHHDCQVLPDDVAIALVEHVTASARQYARACLDVLASEIDPNITGIALRRCPELPPTIIERIDDYRAQNVADTVMYRNALADAATAKGWAVSWYVAKTVFADAARALKRRTIDDLVRAAGKSLGVPWQHDHRLAMAAAIAASASP